MATIMSHNLPLIPLPLKATTAAALAKTTAGLMMSGLLGKHPVEDMYSSGVVGMPTDRSSPDMTSEARSSPESLMMAQPKEQDDDRMSCCSEDSELSVGQEGLGESDKTMNSDEKMSVTSVGSRLAGVDMEKLIDRHSVEASEEMSNDSSRYSSTKEPVDDYMKIPVMRPSPTRLHEEFLRNSQLYAEELMRQQMQIVAAARGLNLSPKPLDSALGLVSRLQDNRSPARSAFPEEQRIGFRPHIRGVAELYQDPNRWSDERSVRSPPESSSFRGIHSHLSAISQITQNLNSDMSKLASPSSLTSMASRESSQSPPQGHAQLLQLNNNIALNDQNLKFSIDNILKADFGRRITEPLKRSGKSYAKKPSATTEKTTAAMDLSSMEKLGSGLVVNGASSDMNGNGVGVCSSASVASRSFNTSSSSASGSEIEVPASPQSSTGSIKTGGGDGAGSSERSGNSGGGSGGPIVWPAWVYCTRYSDRPSSVTTARGAIEEDYLHVTAKLLMSSDYALLLRLGASAYLLNCSQKVIKLAARVTLQQMLPRSLTNAAAAAANCFNASFDPARRLIGGVSCNHLSKHTSRTCEIAAVLLSSCSSVAIASWATTMSGVQVEHIVMCCLCTV
ncbi:homeobox protein invected-like [Sabethes cyaneus]|uniref:homeobox protein invected-like n=1 Tax=Sabethes cyaneus TaxID=53552 RepID=UPI00237EDCEE|nr:homeobox protein invected-like [Sabethes cyaneus]